VGFYVNAFSHLTQLSERRLGRLVSKNTAGTISKGLGVDLYTGERGKRSLKLVVESLQSTCARSAVIVVISIIICIHSPPITVSSIWLGTLGARYPCSRLLYLRAVFTASVDRRP